MVGEEIGAKFALLFPGQAGQLWRGGSPLDQGKGLEHSVVQIARDPLPHLSLRQLVLGAAQHAHHHAADRPDHNPRQAGRRDGNCVPPP